jgi:hypothetical protein
LWWVVKPVLTFAALATLVVWPLVGGSGLLAGMGPVITSV